MARNNKTETSFGIEDLMNVAISGMKRLSFKKSDERTLINLFNSGIIIDLDEFGKCLLVVGQKELKKGIKKIRRLKV